MSADFADNRQTRPAPLFGGAALAVVLWAAPVSLSGQAEPPPLAILETILDSSDFGGVKETWGIRAKEKEADGKRFRRLTDYAGIKKIAARALSIALGLGVAVCAVCALAYVYNRRLYWGKQEPHDAASRTADLPPAYWLRLAQERFASGREREAWAACLKAWAAWMRDMAGLEKLEKKVSPGATEQDLLALLRDLGESGENGEKREKPEKKEKIRKEFADFLDQWIPFAYAGIPPSPGAFQARIRFCAALVAGDGHG